MSYFYSNCARFLTYTFWLAYQYSKIVFLILLYKSSIITIFLILTLLFIKLICNDLRLVWYLANRVRSALFDLFGSVSPINMFDTHKKIILTR